MKTEELYNIFRENRKISTDSRKLIPGSIFFALKGGNFDGNKFALEALEKGCSFAVTDDPSIPQHKGIIRVKDVLKSLQELAAFHRKQLDIPFIGITGSNGKTTSKELIAAVLGRKFRVCATTGNLNNHIGVPLTILSVNDHDIAIIEMGANHIGEIAALCRIADPDFGIITNIGKAHLEGFGSAEGVIRGKSELYDHLRISNGTAFVDGTNDLLIRLSGERNLSAIYFGNRNDSSCRGNITGNSKFLSIQFSFPGQDEMYRVNSSLVGDYNLSNLLAAACIGNYFGVGATEIVKSLEEYQPSNNRSQLIKTDKNRIVMDAYNANPSSMEGAISNFLSLEEDLEKMIILGDMLELGEYSAEEHSMVINRLESINFKNFILVGPQFGSVAKEKAARCFKNVDELLEHFRSNPVVNHSILIKGSRGIQLEKLLEVL